MLNSASRNNQSSIKMKIAKFGANGDSGREIMNSILERGHSVVAAVRRPETVTATESVQVRKVNLNDVDSIVTAIDGCDVVVSAIGSGKLVAASKHTTIYSEGTKAIGKAMRKQGIKRLLVLSSSGLEYDEYHGFVYLCCLRRYIMNTYVDMARMEGMVEEWGGRNDDNNIEWTLVRLPYITPGPSKEFFVKELTGGNECQNLLHFVDVGKFVAREIDERKYIGKFPAPAYKR